MLATLPMISARWWRKTGDCENIQRLHAIASSCRQCGFYVRCRPRLVNTSIEAQPPRRRGEGVQGPVGGSVVGSNQHPDPGEPRRRFPEQFQSLADDPRIARHQESRYVAARMREAPDQTKCNRVIGNTNPD